MFFFSHIYCIIAYSDSEFRCSHAVLCLTLHSHCVAATVLSQSRRNYLEKSAVIAGLIHTPNECVYALF